MSDSTTFKESLSLEETNKVRISLGLKPLSDSTQPTSSGEKELTGDELAEKNYSEQRERERKERESKRLKERLDKARNKRELGGKLKGRTLGDSDDDDGDDSKGKTVKGKGKGKGKGKEEVVVGGGGEEEEDSTKAWLRKSRKRTKEREREMKEKEEKERQLEKLQRERRERGEEEYGEDDLSSLRVLHSLSSLSSTNQPTILTLRDSLILADEDDELQNVNLAEYERTKARKEREKMGKNVGRLGMLNQTTGLYDEDEWIEGDEGDGGEGRKRGVLEKYDDEDSGLLNQGREGGFTIGQAREKLGKNKKMNLGADGLQDDGMEMVMGKVNKTLLDLDYDKSFHDDYLKEGDAGFKKMTKKKKKPRSTRKVKPEDNDDSPSMDVDPSSSSRSAPRPTPVPIQKRNLDEDNLVDDDELQASLARERRKKMVNERKKNKVGIEGEVNGTPVAPDGPGATGPSEGGGMELDTGISSKKDDDDNDEDKDGDDDDDNAGGGIIMDDTTEFIRTIAADGQGFGPASRGPGRFAPKKTTTRTNDSKSQTPGENGEMETTNGIGEVAEDSISKGDEPIGEVEMEEGEVDPEKEEGNDDQRDGLIDTEMRDPNDKERHHHHRRTSSSIEPNGDIKDKGKGKGRATSESIEKEKEEEKIGTAGESLVSSGMSSTLSLLRNQGLIKAQTPESLLHDQSLKDREFWLQEQRKREALREEERMKARKAGNSKDQHQREVENRIRDQNEAKRVSEAFKDYKPVVEIKYHDEFGRELGQKEAWKALSHKFHGKGSGRGKTEKLLKKIAEEKKREGMASGDTPSGAMNAFNNRQEKLGEATMVLSVGNKMAAPQQDHMLSTNLQKPSTSKSSKSKSKKAGGNPSSSSVPSNQLSNPPSLLTNINPPAAALNAPSSSVRDSASPGIGEGSPSGIDSPAGGGVNSNGWATPSMVPRATASRFAPVKGTSSPLGMGTPRGAGGSALESKFKIGLGTKRKAEGDHEGEGTPPRKR